MATAVSNSQSMEFSSSFFDFGDLEQTKKLPDRMVRVHVIGRCRDYEDQPGTSNSRTYHQIWWQVGKEIGADDYSKHKDSTGELYVVYRCVDNVWSHWCVSRTDFDRYKILEDAHRKLH